MNAPFTDRDAYTDALLTELQIRRELRPLPGHELVRIAQVRRYEAPRLLRAEEAARVVGGEQ